MCIIGLGLNDEGLRGQSDCPSRVEMLKQGGRVTGRSGQLRLAGGWAVGFFSFESAGSAAVVGPARRGIEKSKERNCKMKYVTFDLEITKEIPEGEEDWKSHRPLGISCAATRTSSGEARLWHGHMPKGAIFNSVMYPPRMTPRECQDLAFYLTAMQDSGWRIVTFNGLGFDLDVLQEECGGGVWLEACQSLAMEHVDIGFQILCQKGFMVGLAAMADGFKLAGKTEGMKGALAPIMWAESREAQDKVLEYVAQDVKVTADVYEALVIRKELWWITKKGYRSRSPYEPIMVDDGDGGKRLLTVTEALMLPEPNTAWMDKPWLRSRFTGWST